MTREDDTNLILVVEDVHETRDGIEKLLKADGYRVAVARDEPDAVESAQRLRPDLILVSLAGLSSEVIVTAHRIRDRAGVGENVPVVVFCIEGIGHGDEVAIGSNVYITRPDNFNQLRSLIARLLNEIPIAAWLPSNATSTATGSRRLMNSNTGTIRHGLSSKSLVNSEEVTIQREPKKQMWTRNRASLGGELKLDSILKTRSTGKPVTNSVKSSATERPKNP